MNAQSSWSRAAKDGLILAAVTVIITLISGWNKSGFLGILLWAVKFIGSIMVLRAAMKAFGKDNPSTPTLGYGLKVCLCSSLVCAVWAFVMYSYVFPDIASTAFEAVYESFGQSGLTVTDQMSDALAKLEDNYAQYTSMVSFVWDLLLGLLISSILANSTKNNDIFSEAEDSETLE